LLEFTEIILKYSSMMQHYNAVRFDRAIQHWILSFPIYIMDSCQYYTAGFLSTLRFGGFGKFATLKFVMYFIALELCLLSACCIGTFDNKAGACLCT